jgi:hypothetical protein
VTATRVPDGAPVETIHHRMFVDIYDVWPLTGPATHDRVGNRRPFGWVKSGDLLAWDTRLVVRLAAGTEVSETGPRGAFSAPLRESRGALPVTDWTADAVQVVLWARDRPWEEVERRVWVRLSDLPPERWGVWLSRDELLVLLRRTLDAGAPSVPEVTRLRAVLGQVGADHALSAADVAAARRALPGLVFDNPRSAQEASDGLARVNEHWTPEASWSGISFQSVPLSCLP